MGNRLVALVATALSITAGCLSGGPPGNASNVEAAAAPGGATTSNTAAAPSGTAGAPTPVTFTGRTSAGACQGTAVATNCVGALSSDNALHELPPGNMTSIEGALEWKATSPTQTELAIMLLRKDGDGWRWEDGMPYERGPSPVAIAWDLAAYAGATMALYVSGYSGAGVAVVWASASTPADFTFTGELSAAPQAGR